MTGSEWRPNAGQQAAVSHTTGPLRLLAGAGSGKTTTLVRRIASLVERGLCRPSEVLMLTFTNKAAAEMRERVQALLGTAEQPRVETYHAFAWSLVRAHAVHLGLPPEPVLLTGGPARLFTRLRFDALGISRLDLTRLDDAVQKLLDFFGWHRHEGAFRRPEADLFALLAEPDDPDLIREFLGAYRHYRRLLREQGAADFDDVIALAVELLEQHPDVRLQVQARFRFLLVDEYQDTDYLQGELIRLLAGEQANITIVGDPDQTIYAFRGAAVTNILHFDQAFAGAESVYMVANYRSTPEIVAAANRVIRHNVRRKEEELAAVRESGRRPVLLTAPDWESEARWLAAQAKELHEQDGIPYGEMAVLVRKNKHKLPLYAALAEAGVPAVAGALDLWDDGEAGRLIAYLGALADPDDDASVSVALAMPRYGLTDREVAELAQARQRGESRERLLQAAVRLARSNPRVARFLEEFWPLYHLQFADGPLASIRGALRLHRSSLSPQAQANCEQLIPLAEGLLAYPHLFAGLGGDGAAPLALFCRYLRELRKTGGGGEGAEPDVEADAVRLLTVHAVKGLEFQAVFLPRLTKLDFHPKSEKWGSPFPLAWHHDREFVENHAAMGEEEERRLFYVAITRARDRLFLSWAPHDPARKRPLEPSAFVAEVAEACDQVTLPGAVEAEVAATGADAGGSGASGPQAAAPFDVEAAIAPLISDRPAPPLPTPAAVPVEADAPEVLSFSHLHTYQLCPYRFYLQYILWLPGRPSPAADDGIRVHAAIENLAGLQGSGAEVGFEQFVALAGAPAIPQEADLTGAAPDDDLLDLEPEPPALGDALRHFWDSEFAATAPLATEQEFHIRIGDAVVRGFIDRIHRRPDGTVEVVDFKTYNRLLSEADVRAGLQLPLYIRACRDALGYPAVTQGALFFLKHGQVVRVRYTDEELDERLHQAASLVAAIRAREWAPAPGHVCRWCQYREVCPVAEG